MTTFAALHSAAEAAKAAYQRQGQTAGALKDWLTAEVAYVHELGETCIAPPSAPPQLPYQCELYRTLAATLCNFRYRHFHALAAVA